MINVINSLFSAPALPNADDRRTAGILNIVLLTLLAVSVPILFLTLDIYDGVSIVTVMLLLMDILFLGFMWGIRRGYLDVPSFVTPITLLLVITIAVINGNGLHSIAVFGYWLVIALATLLVGRRGPILFTLLSIAALTNVYVLEVSGQIDTPFAAETDFSDLLIISLFFFISAVLMQIMVNSLYSSLAQVRELNVDLEARVAARTRELQAALEDAQKARAEAERANSVKSSFLASVSHELRTPLNAIINFTRFMLKERMGPITPRQQEALTTVADSGKHLLNLINDVLDISKIESGSLELFVEQDIQLAGELKTAVLTSQVLLAGKPVELETQFDENLPPISGDRQRILQIILNLLSNACKFTEEGKITLSVYPQGSEVIIEVKDTGPGIDPSEHTAVFESFRQTSTGLKQGSGSGLGMPISKRLAEAHGGRLWVESQAGSGATFYVALPAQKLADPVPQGV